MDAMEPAAIRARVTAVRAELPAITNLARVLRVAGADAELLLDEVDRLVARVQTLEAGLGSLTAGPSGQGALAGYARTGVD